MKIAPIRLILDVVFHGGSFGEGLRVVGVKMGVVFVKKQKKWRGAQERVGLEVG